MEGAMLQRVLLDEAIEVRFQFAGHLGWSTGAGTIEQALGALVGKAIDPLAAGRVGERERIGDGLQAGGPWGVSGPLGGAGGPPPRLLVSRPHLNYGGR